MKLYFTFADLDGRCSNINVTEVDEAYVDLVLQGCNGVAVDPDTVQFPAYIEEGVLHPCADYSLDALPLPCTVVIEDQQYPCTEQPTFSFDAPGTYRITVIPESNHYKVKAFSYEYQP